MKKTIMFNKIAFTSKRKVNRVSVSIALEDREKGPVFSASGDIWNASGTDLVCGGQCLDTIAKTTIGHNPKFKKIHRLWKLYHLNDMHAGTPAQEKAVHEHFNKDNRYDYDKACDYLKSINLYEDNGYEYGHGWLYQPIPEEDLNQIRELLKD